MLSEQDPPGNDFLAHVIQHWESAFRPAADAGVRIVNLRSGIVLSRAGGALARMLLLFRLGLGGRLGSGRQYFPCISLEDMVGVVGHCIEIDAVEGPINLTAPDSVTNRVP